MSERESSLRSEMTLIGNLVEDALQIVAELDEENSSTNPMMNCLPQDLSYQGNRLAKIIPLHGMAVGLLLLLVRCYLPP
jgi:hypothetical protein